MGTTGCDLAHIPNMYLTGRASTGMVFVSTITSQYVLYRAFREPGSTQRA